MPDKLVEYAQCKRDEKRAKARAEELKPDVLIEVSSIRGDTGNPVQLEGLGAYTLKARKTWTYSPAVTNLERQLAELKQEEERTKVATYEENVDLVFTVEKQLYE